MIELTEVQVVLVGGSYFVACLLFIGFAILAIHHKKQKDEYKTAVWCAMGKVQQGESADEILKTMECYMPDNDVAHFRRTFFGEENEHTNRI